MKLIIPAWTDAPVNVGAMITTRHGGVSLPPYDNGEGGGGLNLGDHVGDNPADVAHNRGLLSPYIPAEPLWMTQVHGVRVVDAAKALNVVDADAAIATRAGVVCAIMTADCLPVLFCDVAGRVVGAAHAGWRGLVGGVLEQTVACMRDAGAGEILAWLGPAIGPQHFEVGEDVRAAFISSARERLASATVLAQIDAAFVPIVGLSGNAVKYLADIYHLARTVLSEVSVHRVSGGGACTVSDRQFYSFRRDKVTGRMASLIWLK
ncbi:peptidoglycan editing factor PgeF [Glaciimonas immobilis]|uniref:Purine nucleoside phosphorylase n=1 Tax=Glaciimonas immobilis TaxID=728004 RepID=A0A840RP47_9BURK|nr:peptidoglycan editing factor PgeF [Glaciimonas immobilis]KAF3999000.1 peptidoglycan editing factor PgeF [Glaciimonas immobilis]MBB5198420.1 hypothetical protein [Glaciimonas immobilis]